MRTLAVSLAIALAVPPIGALAEDAEVGASTTTTTTEVTTTTVAPTTTPEPTTTTTVATATTLDPCSTQGYACGWSILDDNNRVVSVIVCTYEVCGSGTFDGKRVAVQTRQSPDGNVAGYNGATYDQATNTYTIDGVGTLVGGAEVTEVSYFPTTTVVSPPVTGDPTGDTVEPTTTTTQDLVASAVFAVERTIPRVSTKSVVSKRKPVAKKVVKKVVVRRTKPVSKSVVKPVAAKR